MARLSRDAVEALVRILLKPALTLPPPVSRPLVDLLSRLNVLPAGVVVARQARGGLFGDLASPDGQRGPSRILYLHGGAYEGGSPRTHSALITALAVATDEAVFALDYRLAPEHPAPAALADALAAYEAMAVEAEGRVALAGDSAGGGLALATAVAARDQALPAPVAIALVSPWVDLTLSGSSYRDNSGRDAMLSMRTLRRGARGYAGTLGVEDPVCSPIRADLAGLPPMLVHAGGNDLLLSDAQELARRAGAAGVEVELRVHEGLWHDFHSHAGTLPEADEAVAAIGAFLAARLDQA